MLLFFICFATVHIFKLAYLGFLSLKKKPDEKPPVEKKPAKPTYYIVEKKRPRRASYSEPREIEFKD